MNKFLNKLARWALKDEIHSKDELIKRLQGYARKNMPEIKADGTDQTANIQYHYDVNNYAYLPPGEYRTSSPIDASTPSDDLSR